MQFLMNFNNISWVIVFFFRWSIWFQFRRGQLMVSLSYWTNLKLGWNLTLSHSRLLYLTHENFQSNFNGKIATFVVFANFSHAFFGSLDDLMFTFHLCLKNQFEFSSFHRSHIWLAFCFFGCWIFVYFVTNFRNRTLENGWKRMFATFLSIMRHKIKAWFVNINRLFRLFSSKISAIYIPFDWVSSDMFSCT